MKNIHVIPTDNPSRLHFDSELFISPKIQLSKSINSIVEGRNIYITNDEEIKEGDWYYDDFIKQIIIADNRPIGNDCKKIILTTDQELIKDSVQAIDDEFLEWFVKNPSCEFVKTERYKTIYHTWIYKIIIPKEDFDFDKLHYKETFESRQYYIPKEEPTDFSKIVSQEFFNLMDLKEEPKQETLEEAAEREYPKEGEDSTYCDLGLIQQERSYTDGIDLFIAEIKSEFKDDNWDYLEFIKERVLEQFKKK
jgi:hypothetical protein